MSGMIILFVLGICGFLIWFFEAILKDIWAHDDEEMEYIDLRDLRMEYEQEECLLTAYPEEEILTQRSRVA